MHHTTSGPSAEPPVDLQTLSKLWDRKQSTDDEDNSLTTWNAVMSPVIYYVVVGIVLLVGLALGAAFVLLGTQFGPSEAWVWATTVLSVVIVDAVVVEPLRVLLVAIYWTLFRHQLMH